MKWIILSLQLPMLICIASQCIIAQDQNCVGSLGEMKYSILPPDEFKSQNGDCWVLMAGQNIEDSRLGQAGLISIEDMRGYFIRTHDGRNSNRIDVDRNSSTVIGSIQGSQIASHSHSWTDNYNSYFTRQIDQNQHFWGPKLDNLAKTGITTSTNVNRKSQNETRPANIDLWLYIKIN